jgi:flagellar motility protein MotE (MotC chaperone)
LSDDAEKTKQESQPEKAKKAKSGMGGLIKYIIFGVGGLVAVLVIAFGTLMFLGGDKAAEAPAEVAAQRENAAKPSASDNSREADDPHAGEGFNEDSLLAFLEDDASVLEEIMANLDALDYVPGEEEMAGDETSMSVEDSIEAVNWLENEKTKLAEREKELDAREKKLNVLDAKVSQQIVKIEQAESARISKLAKLYDGMEARSVAKLIANLDDDTVVALLPRMKLKQASSVLALMPPIRAARLSKQMITIAEN